MMPLKYRITVFTLLWLLAGVVCAVFAQFVVEAGDSEWDERASMIYLAPLYLSEGLTFVLVPGGYNAWPWHETVEAVVFLGLPAIFLVHAIYTLSRKTRREFMIWTTVQMVLLAAGVASQLYFCHWDLAHGHG